MIFTKKRCFIFVAAILFAGSLFAQSDDELFGGDDDFFFDDDDGIVELEDMTESSAAQKSNSDLSHGVLFDNGSVKIGGSFTTSIGTSVKVYEDNEKTFSDHMDEATLTPTLSAMLSVDARPTQTLRMYTKFGLEYPFNLKATSTGKTEAKDFAGKTMYTTSVNTSVTDWLTLKELFTDFSIADRAFFRFGLHTVTWGTGYFYSPVSDMINTSSIDPENTDLQVDGCLNLRTQLTFPGTQNCLWLYVIPSTDFTNNYTTATYLKDTALAGKFDLVLGTWELGFGGFYKYNNSPKAMFTASGSLKKISMFGEFVYIYGADNEWSKDIEDKSHLFRATAGLSYFWKDPSITLAAQYYYDSNDVDDTKYVTYGHNVAAVANFGRIFGTTDVTATVFASMNFGKEEIPAFLSSYLESYGIASYLNAGTFSAMINYSPISALKFGFGPYLTFNKWDDKPTVALNLNITLGGGKF